ncbi:MAG: divergent PAP2 family protein [Clostridia bacterium]|nr:divergent PAP2 family protein [Clostridia bacterium]MBR6620218.1 divergent PAP2 family protein [Clostridia bacterium]
MRIIIICILAWFTAQLLKVIINSVKYAVAKSKGIKGEKVTIDTLFKLGGMPSSHTATVISLAASVGLHSGWTSDVFAVAGVFAFIVMFDAFKVRLPISYLTDAFNSLRDKVYGRDTEDLKKVEGHTLPEIGGGFVVGFTVAYLMVRVFNFLA